jgi:hypothetical protein
LMMTGAAFDCPLMLTTFHSPGRRSSAGVLVGA